MNLDALNQQILSRLKHEFKFSEHDGHLREGKCPSCGKKTLWTWKDKPGVVQCNRTNHCGFASTTKELFPDLFENLVQKYKPTADNPTRTADVYLSLIRGFNVDFIYGWYEQGQYWHPKGDKGTSTVRFYLDQAKQVMWERLIEDVTISDGDGDVDKEVRNKNFKGSFKGLWWAPPTLTIDNGDEIYWCEGILDAIALNLSGLKAVAIMSSGTFPSESIKPYLHRKVKWIIALDNDKTGRKCLQKHAKRLRDMGEWVGAMISSEFDEKCDWNDLYKQKKLGEDDIKRYRYLGRVELAETVRKKAQVIYEHDRKNPYFVIDFGMRMYSVKVKIEEYEKIKGALEEAHPDCPDKNLAEAFAHSAKVTEISTFKMDFLYFQQPDNGEDGQYFFRLNFSNKAPEIQMPFSGKIFGAAGDFKKQAMQKAPGAQFTGNTSDLDFLYKRWMGRIPKIVKTLDYVGYDRETGAYVYADYAVEHGHILQLNAESFFQLKKQGIKTMVDIKQKLSVKNPVDWLPDFQTAYGIGGLVALAWWFGCLFVEQVRRDYRSYPFFEVVGEPGSGKSDLVDFMWKLYGREGESFNPNSSTLAGRTRKMAEVSNLPVVFNETDNEKTAEDKHLKSFNWDEQKDLYDGEFGRVTGVKSQDNSTKKPTFKAGLMIVQNIQVMASDAILSRIVHLNFDRSHHSMDGKYASDRLNMVAVTDVSGFLLHSVKLADQVMRLFHIKFKSHREQLQRRPEIKMQRLVENYAKVMAFTDCLKLVLPLTDDTVNAMHLRLIRMAVQRQESLDEDHPIVQQFWANFDYLNSKVFHGHGEAEIEQNTMNHSHHPDNEIAVNMEHFRLMCAEKKLETIDSNELRRYLKTSRKRKFKGFFHVKSRLEKRTLRCAVFDA